MNVSFVFALVLLNLYKSNTNLTQNKDIKPPLTVSGSSVVTFLNRTRFAPSSPREQPILSTDASLFGQKRQI